MKLRCTTEPYQGRDGRWYLNVEYGRIAQHLRLNYRGDDAVEVLRFEFGMQPAVAKKALANVGTFVTFTPRAVKISARLDPKLQRAMAKAAKR